MVCMYLLMKWNVCAIKVLFTLVMAVCMYMHVQYWLYTFHVATACYMYFCLGLVVLRYVHLNS